MAYALRPINESPFLVGRRQDIPDNATEGDRTFTLDGRQRLYTISVIRNGVTDYQIMVSNNSNADFDASNAAWFPLSAADFGADLMRNLYGSFTRMRIDPKAGTGSLIVTISGK